MKSKALLPKLIAGLALSSLALLAGSAWLQSDWMRIVGTILLALFGLLITVLIFSAAFILAAERKKKP